MLLVKVEEQEGILRSQCQNQNENFVTSFVIAMLKERETTENFQNITFSTERRSHFICRR